jgi:hypothetical protein
MASIVVKSEAFSFIPEDIKSLAVGALIAGIGALVTFIAENISGVNFGQWTFIVIPAVGVLVNAIRKWIGTAKYAK